ncbi:MAG: hypothetical protein VZS44_01975 [Bacilli bacterium]|nr:hypothetical protein [Bacilli bacterium]
MTSTVIKGIVYALTLSILTLVLNNLHTKDDKKYSNEKDDNNYILKSPDAIKVLGYMFVGLALFVFIIFSIIFLIENKPVTSDYFIIPLFILSIGVFYFIIAFSWRIVVNDDNLEVHRLFRKCINIKINDINKIDFDPLGKGIIIIYGNNKKITIDQLSDNYNKLLKTLEKYGKKPIVSKEKVEVKGIPPLAIIGFLIGILCLFLIVLGYEEYLVDRNILKFISSFLPSLIPILYGFYEIRKYLYMDLNTIKYRKLFITKELSYNDLDEIKYKRSASDALIMYNIKIYNKNKLIFRFTRVPERELNKIIRFLTYNNKKITKK